MNRVAFRFGIFSLHWYSIFIVLGILSAMFIANREIKKQNINKEFFLNLVFYVILFGILGARIYYVLFNLNYYLSNPLEIIMIWHGGLAIHGGILAGLLVTFLYTRKYNVNTLKIIDLMVVGVILAQAIGRWGNFFNQEAYGMATTKEALQSIHLPDFIINGMYIDGSYYQPTFLYESVWNMIGFVIMLFLRRRKYNKIGELTGFYLLWYSIGRFVIEHFRSDSLMLGNLKIAQIISVILAISGIIIIIISKKGSRFDNQYNKKDKDIYF